MEVKMLAQARLAQVDSCATSLRRQAKGVQKKMIPSHSIGSSGLALRVHVAGEGGLGRWENYLLSKVSTAPILCVTPN